jgi:hypothetical protein
VSDDYDEDYFDEEGVTCPRCDGHRTVNCYCGGDQCFCENYGEKDCPLCWGEGYVDQDAADKYLEQEREMAAVLRKAWEEAAAKDKDEKSDV